MYWMEQNYTYCNNILLLILHKTFLGIRKFTEFEKCKEIYEN